MHEMIPIVLFITLFGMIFGIVYIRSKENMAMLEKGLDPRVKDSTLRPFINLKYGLLLLGAGMGLLAAYLIDTNMAHKTTDPSDNPAIYFALIAVGGGLGLIISYVIEKKHWINRNKE